MPKGMLQQTPAPSSRAVSAGGKRRKLGAAADGFRHVQCHTVDCEKSCSAQAAVRSAQASVDSEREMGCADWQQTYRAMRAEAMVVVGSGEERRAYVGGDHSPSEPARRGNSDEGGQHDTLRQVAQSYMRCMEAFVAKQAELALTTLSSDSVKGDKAHAQKVRQQYAAAHEYLLGARSPRTDEPEPRALRLDMLLTAHKLLMRDLCVTPGEFRTVPARCGNCHFALPTEIAGLMEQLVSGLAVVLARRDMSMSGKAAWAMGHLLAIHPFNDGNGRLGQLLANWVLVSCGLPFAVVLCSSDAQRADYIKVCRAYTDSECVFGFVFWHL